MDADLARLEVLLLGLQGSTALWEALLHLNELAPGLDEAELLDIAASALRSLSDDGCLAFARGADSTALDRGRGRRLRHAEVVALLSELGWHRVPPEIDVRFGATPKGERRLAAMLGGPVPGPRARVLGKVFAGFAGAVRHMVEHRQALPRGGGGRVQDPQFGFGGQGDYPDLDDDSGLAGSPVPRLSPDRSGSGAAIAAPDDVFDFDVVAPARPGDVQ